jgi:hypothetical protein
VTSKEGTPFHRRVGLLQRILVAVWFTRMMVIARKAPRVAREDGLASTRASA